MAVAPIVAAAAKSWLAPAITAAATTASSLGGAALASRANNRATDAQERAAREAMQYQRERERNQGARYDTAYQDYRRQYDQWVQQFYGNRGSQPGQNNVGSPAAPAPTTSAPVGAAPGGVAPPATPGAPIVPPMTGAPVAPPVSTTGSLWPDGQAQSLADLGGWSDWRRYGAGV